VAYCKFLSHSCSRQTEDFLNIISVNISVKGISNFSLFNDNLNKS